MAAPNILALGTVNVKTAILQAPSSGLADLISAVPSDTAYQVESVLAVNGTAVTHWCSLALVRSATTWILGFQTRIPGRSAVNLLYGKPLYLEEGDALQVLADADDVVLVIAPYSSMAT